MGPYVTHDQARSYAYRWSEDGLAGICDAQQRLCLAFAFWIVDVVYAKAAPDDICVRLVARNRSGAPASLDVLPTLWFRNTWRWGDGTAKPLLRHEDGAIAAEHETLGRYLLCGDGAPEPLFCDNEPNARRLWNEAGPPFPKDGIGDHVVHGGRP